MLATSCTQLPPGAAGVCLQRCNDPSSFHKLLLLLCWIGIAGAAQSAAWLHGSSCSTAWHSLRDRCNVHVLCAESDAPTDTMPRCTRVCGCCIHRHSKSVKNDLTIYYPQGSNNWRTWIQSTCKGSMLQLWDPTQRNPLRPERAHVWSHAYAHPPHTPQTPGKGTAGFTKRVPLAPTLTPLAQTPLMQG